MASETALDFKSEISNLKFEIPGGAQAQPPNLRLITGGLFVIATSLRLVEYLRNKAIWLDEAHLALSVLRRSYAGLLEPLDYGQGAPLGFLWAERFFVNHFGAGEFSLRFVPLIASLISCVLIYVFLRRMLRGGGFAIALAIFAFAVPVIRYASEVKPYASDLAVALALLLLLIPAKPAPFTLARIVTLALAGVVSVWLAFPAIFVIGGIGIVYVLESLRKKDWKQAFALCVMGAVWLASFTTDYFLMLRHNANNAEVRTWWLDRFMPLPPTSLSDMNWFVRTFFEVFNEPLGLGVGGVGALLFAFGVYALWIRDRLRLALLLAPIGAMLIGSGLQMYPIWGRFLLFAVPLMLILIGEGWGLLRDRTNNRTIVAIVGAVLLVQPVIGSIRGIVKPAEQGVRPAFDYLSKNWKDDDKLYVYDWACPSFLYYESKTGRVFSKIEGQSSRADWAYHATEFTPLRGAPRVWVVLTNTPKQLVGEEDKYILTHLESAGRRISAKQFDESSVYLFDLSQAPANG